MNNELDNMLVPCCEERRYLTFWVIPVGKASLFLNCLHAEAKNVADSSFSKMTWISSMNTCVRLPLRQFSFTRLIMASVMTSKPIVFNCFPRLKILNDNILDLMFTLLSWAKIFNDPFVNSSSLIASDFASVSGWSNNFLYRCLRVGV